MHRSELGTKKIVIWGTGMEGQAAARYIRERFPRQSFVFFDENSQASVDDAERGDIFLTDLSRIEEAALSADVIVKSPGVSLYHPVLLKAKAKQIPITSLLNLWSAENDPSRVVMITGTKGKSTTASLLTHVLEQLGKHVTLLGNFGVPVTACKAADYDYVVLEASSYQASNFDGEARLGLMTSLYPEHLDWHRTIEQYYADKCQLLKHCRSVLITQQALGVMREHGISLQTQAPFDTKSRFHFAGTTLYNGEQCIGDLENDYLLRPHNRINVCGVMALIEALGLPHDKALEAMKYYKGLPHRQQEIGEIDGVLYVDDSISTTPQSAVAALKVYANRPITLIAGGQDRGIDFSPLSDYILRQSNIAVVCLGESGKPIFNLLQTGGARHVMSVATMKEALAWAKEVTPEGGVVLLSPASPSYDMYENYMARAASFAKEAGIDPAR